MNTQQHALVEQFAMQCKDLSHDEIYELFEDNTGEATRDAVYEYSAEVYPDSPEPFRAACDAMGHKYNIETLKTY